MSKEPRIGRHMHIDSTGFAVNARLHHCCPDHAACKQRGGRPKQVLDRAPAEMVEAERHGEAALPEDTVVKARSQADASRREAEENERLLEQRLELDAKHGGYDGWKYTWLGPKGHKHLYRFRDRSAGVRMYQQGKRKKVWLGGYDTEAVDDFTGAPVALHMQAADVQEDQAYIPLMERAMANTGARPVAVATDRGFSWPAIYRWNTEHGIGSVLPWREPKAGLRRDHYETDRYDRHGVPRCEHCGAPGQRTGVGLGFTITGRGHAVIRFRCELGITDACKTKAQTLRCDEDWRLLGPINPTDKLYHQLRKGHGSLERVHGHWRQRYLVAGANFLNIPKRCGLSVQRLRAAGVR